MIGGELILVLVGIDLWPQIRAIHRLYTGSEKCPGSRDVTTGDRGGAEGAMQQACPRGVSQSFSPQKVLLTGLSLWKQQEK